MAPLFHAGPRPHRGVTGEVPIAMVRRHWIAGSFLILTGFGCHAGPPAKLATPETPIKRSDVSAARFIARHNRNAAAIQSLEASPSIALINDRGERDKRVNGHLALEGRKKFRLEVEAFRRPLADIGSNDQEFWFWVKDDKEKSIYFCEHRNINSSQLAVTLQPEWIMEAMGLRAFTDDEAKKVYAKDGETPGTIVLTQFRKDGRGQTYTKETIVKESSAQILEHRLYAGAKKELLASAVMTNYFGVRFTDSSKKDVIQTSGEAGTAPGQTIVQLPGNVRLTWVREKFAIDITMPKATVNPTFAPERRVALFEEPKIPDTTRKDLALLDPAAPAAPSSRVYESRPIPQSKILLGRPEPSPIDAEGVSRRAIDPVPLSADLSSTPAQPVGVVGAPIPSGDSSTVQASSTGSWRSRTLGR